jgi:hypothetical protein
MSNVFVFRRPPHGVITEYFGGGKGGSTTTTNNVTQIPPEVLARYNAVNARAETVAQAPYQAYSQDPNAFVAPLSQTQQAGIQNTNAMAGAAQPYYGAATGLAAQSTGSVNPSGLNVGQYMNPYTQSVVNATQAAMNQQQGQQLSQQQADAIRGGAFGGDRAGLQRAQLMGQQSLAQAQAIAPLYQQNYNQALAAAQQQQGVGLGAEQANRQNLQNAAQLFGNIGTSAQQAGLAGAQAQMQAGQQQQQTQQAGLQALYNQFQQQQGFPYQQAQFLANIATGTGALSGNASSGTSTTTGGGGFFSDERLKENIKKVGETNDGQPIYRYNYKGDQRTQIGLLAQDVEKDHPEAVGSSQGYKTVDYKKATEGAIHKEDGGALSGTDAYSIGAPSAMLRENSGKGLGAMPSLPQAFMGGRDIPIEAGASGAGLAAMRSPTVTGFAPGVREGKQAELASLQSSMTMPPGPNGELLGSGKPYLENRINTLQDWLNQNNSQGGLVGPQGGSFARGGLAEGDYMNPALAYYGPQQAQGGLYGAQLQPLPQRQILQGTPMQAPQQRQQPDAITSANQMAGLVGNLNSAYKARPDFLRSAEDVKARAQTADAIKAREILDIAKARKLDETGGGGDDLLEGGDEFARGGYAGRGYVNPYGGLGGGNDILGPIIEEQDTSRRLSNDKVTPPPQPKQQSSGLGELAQMANAGKSLYKGGEWAAGKLGLGAPETAMSATSTGASAMPGVIDLTSGAGIAGAAPEALSAGLASGEALAGGAAAAEGLAAGAGLAELGAGAAAAGAGIMEALPFLAFLSDERAKHDIKKIGTLFDGQPVYRYAYNGDDKTQMGLLAQKVEKAAPEAVGLAGGMKTVNYEKATDKAAKRGHYQDGSLVVPEDAPLVAEGGNETATTGGDGETVVGRGAPLARNTRPTPTPADAVAPVPAPRAREPGVASASRPSIPDFGGLVPEGMKDTLSSENFWVPALAGIGSMLASPNKTLAGAIGSGLVGGTGAYTELQKQNAVQTKQRFELAKDLFKGPVEGEDKKLYWRHVPSGRLVPQEEYERLYSDFVRGSAGTPRSTAPSSETPAVATAREVVTEEKPRPIKAPTVPPASAAATAGAPAPVPDAAQAQAVQPPAAPVSAEGQPVLKNKTQIKNEMLSSPQTWADAPRERNPILLRQEAARLEGEVRQLREKARRIATTMPENTVEGPRLTSEANQLDANRKEMIERSEKILEDAAELAYEDQKAQSAALTGQKTGRMAVPTSPDVPLPQGMTVAQAENDPDYLGARIESNMKKYNELKARGALKEAGDYSAKVEKDRAQLQTVIGTEFTTSYGTKYSVHPNADVFNVTQPKPIPKDYKANVDPNTGIVVPKPIGEFIGYPETGGHPVDPVLIGKKAIIRGTGDERVLKSKAKSDELEKAFVGGAEKAEDGIATIIKFSTAAKVLESKGMNIPYAELANIARGLGFEGIANQLMSDKNTAAAFTALKTNVDQAVNQVTNNFARPTQAEFLITEKKATPSIDMPKDAARSLTQTRLAGLMWQNAILSDWENAKRETNATNFEAFQDVWRKTHPKALFEDAADRVLGNFKGQSLPPVSKIAEGVVYVVPADAGSTSFGKYLTRSVQEGGVGLRPGDLFVTNNIDHAKQKDQIGTVTRVTPEQAYKMHLNAPALTYGAR